MADDEETFKITCTNTLLTIWPRTCIKKINRLNYDFMLTAIMDLTILSLNSCFYNTECCIEWKRLIEALIKHCKAQKERSNLYSIGSDIQHHEEAQKRNMSVLKQELKRYRWNIEI